MDDESRPPVRRGSTHSIESLHLNLEEARQGRTWLLLPEDYRSGDWGKTYPLPTSSADLQLLSAIPIPRYKQDCGSKYLRRALRAWRLRIEHRQSIFLEAQRHGHEADVALKDLNAKVERLEGEAKAAVSEVHSKAQEAIASLNELFALGREGIEGQMRAHIRGEQWKGEGISASAFRDCFKMVTQAVKGLGLPSEQQDKAREAIMEEVAASVRGSQEALAMAPGAGEKGEPN